jgi:hypothetical protein
MRAATTLAGMTTPRRTGGMHGTPCSATPRPRSKRFRHGHIGEIEGLQIRERRERAEWCRDAVDTETQARQLREPGSGRNPRYAGQGAKGLRTSKAASPRAAGWFGQRTKRPLQRQCQGPTDDRV